MDVENRAFVIWILFGVLVFGSARGNYFSQDSAYDRIDEVKRHCSSVLSSAAEPKNEDLGSIQKDLSFVNGDWNQDSGGHPIIPVHKRAVDIFHIFNKPLNLTSFWITEVDRHNFGKSVAVNGLLVIGFTSAILESPEYSPKPSLFRIDSYGTLLSIKFQGVYFESNKNEGEKILCLLGSTARPSRGTKSDDQWKWGEELGPDYSRLPLLPDNQILLILRYPTTFSLMSRVVRGEMRSLNKESGSKYFDTVHISSQLGNMANYKFGSEKLISKSCQPYPYKDSLFDDSNEVYKRESFCTILNGMNVYESSFFTFMPNWKCNGTNEYCSRLGPFLYNEKLKVKNGSFDGFQVVMQNIACKQLNINGESNAAKVSAVFRIVDGNHDFSYSSSALDNMTAVAEGIWRPSSGQLCMLACHGSNSLSCDSRICLYIPVSFSISQRSRVVGTMSSIKEPGAGFFPLSFHKPVHEGADRSYFTSIQARYTYSKLNKARVILDRNQPTTFQTKIKKSLLNYPKLEDNGNYEISWYNLVEDLSFQSTAQQTNDKLRTLFSMDILSIGALLGRYWGLTTENNSESPYHNTSEYTTETQLLMNVSGYITMTERVYRNLSSLSVEGLYDPYVGKMYLIGCRDVRASWEVLRESMDLEGGLDCLIEVIISYPPTNSRWLASPKAEISIVSSRNDDDPLLFSPIKLRTLPLMYRKQRLDILSTISVETVLQILTLSFSLACILSQIFYVGTHPASVPFMSLVMLGIEAFGLSIPLITGAEALFKKAPSAPRPADSFVEAPPMSLIQASDYIVKVLVLLSFLLTLRLCQKVWKSRSRLLSSSVQDSHLPSEKRVFLITSILHIIGFAVVLYVYPTNKLYRPEGWNQTPKWKIKLEEYIGLVQDFFLLPQIIGNFLWQTDGSKPLRKVYFIGITMVRILPHLYDYMKALPRNPYYPVDYTFANPTMDFYTKFGDIIISAIALIFAVMVYIQQTWSLTKVRSGTASSIKSRYERVPSTPNEIELGGGDSKRGTD